MHISPITNLNFESKLAYDDEISSQRRDYIREHIKQNYLYNVDIFKQNGSPKERKMQKLLQNFGIENAGQGRTNDLAKELPAIFKVRRINGTNSYIGSTYSLDDKSCKILKGSGIKGVISFLREHFPEEICTRNGLETYMYPTSVNLWEKDMFKNEEEVCSKAEREWTVTSKKESLEGFIKSKKENWRNNKRRDIDDFVKFIQFMQKDSIYCGCAMTVTRTKNALILNRLFNPKAPNTEYYFEDNYYSEKILNLYNNLTPEDKKKMGWDEEFDKSFVQRLEKCVQETVF